MIIQLAKKEITNKSLLSLVVFILFLLIVQPFLWGMVKSRVKELHNNRTLKEQIKQVDKKNNKIRNNYNTDKTHLAQLSLSAPQDKSSIQIIEKIEKKARELGLRIEISRIDEGTVVNDGTSQSVSKSIEQNDTDIKDGLIFPLYITLSVSGPPESLISYIDTIEHLQELSAIQKISISPYQSKTKINSKANLFEALITVIFYQQEKDGIEKQ